MLYSIDIETQNEGINVFDGVKKVLSIQIGDDEKQELYYADGKDRFTLTAAKARIESLLDEGHSFAGYNIKNFDIPKLKEFLDIDIPQNKIVDIIEMKGIAILKEKLRRERLKLEEVCHEYHVDASHKTLMVEFSQRFRTPKLLEEANNAAKELIVKGWRPQFATNYAIDSLATKQAIIESYHEFLLQKGSSNTLFHKYAVGDIISEHKLLRIMEKVG